jgi:hypothetical protein
MTEICKGLRFTSQTFSAQGEVSAVRPDLNQVDVIFTPGDDMAWEQKDLDLKHMKAQFERGEFQELIINPNDNKYTVW